MSEEEGKHFCVRNATPKHREIWKNIALVTWLLGLVPSMVAVVILTGTALMFAILVILNSIFIIINCVFCCVTLQTIKKKRIFYITCLLLTLIITAVVVVAVLMAPEDAVQVVGFVGCGLIFFSCVSFGVLCVLLHIHGPADPVNSERTVEAEAAEEVPSEVLSIRYVSVLRGRIQDESVFRVQAGQVLSLSSPRTDQAANTTESSQTTTRTRRPSVFGFRTREEPEEEQERRRSIESLPIRIISDGVFCPLRRDSNISQVSLNSQHRVSVISQNSQRRDSTISMLSTLRRTSVTSIEYDTTSVRCTCFDVNETTESDDVPPYLEAPLGNINVCPLHGENPIAPPSYDNNTSPYNSLCKLLGLPEYNEVVITKPILLSSMLKESAAECNTASLATTPGAITVDSPIRAGPLCDRISAVQPTFETIFEDRSERSDSFLSETGSDKSDTAPPSSTMAPTHAAATTITTTEAEDSSPSEPLTTDQATYSTSKQTA